MKVGHSNSFLEKNWGFPLDNHYQENSMLPQPGHQRSAGEAPEQANPDGERFCVISGGQG